MDKQQMEQLFLEEYGYQESEIHTFFSPGRVNLIGEHIDYNGGFVFPAALTIGIYGAIRYRTDNLIYLRSKNIEGEIILDLDKELKYRDKDGWGNYPKGVIKSLLDKGHMIKGMDIMLYSDLPDGAGLSSSAALEVLTAYMLLYLENEENIDRIEISKICQSVENQFVGVNCGIMDQFSVALGKKDKAILLDCNTLKYKYVPLTLGIYSLIIINTNKKRELSDSKYNERKLECEMALDLINRNKDIKLENLCQASLDDIEKFILDKSFKKRAIHVVTENARVIRAADMLEKGEIDVFAKLMTESHISLKNDYEVTGFYLDTLVESALNIKGCIGARMTGAGFGGCAIAIVENSKIDIFKNQVAEEYEKITGRIPDFYISSIGDGVRSI